MQQESDWVYLLCYTPSSFLALAEETQSQVLLHKICDCSVFLHFTLIVDAKVCKCGEIALQARSALAIPSVLIKEKICSSGLK